MKTASLLCGILLILLAPTAHAADADKHLPMIDELFRDFNRPDAPGASVMIIRDGKVLLAKSYGLAELAYSIPSEIVMGESPATPDSNYRLASVSKQFTAMSIMIPR